MSWQLIYTEQYMRKAAKFIKQHPDALNQYAKTLALMEINPHHPSLRMHNLEGRLNGLQSVFINLKYHITIETIVTEKDIILVNVGDHNQVY